MIDCNQDKTNFIIEDENLMNTSDIINPIELRKQGSHNATLGSIYKLSALQIPQQQQQQQTQMQTEDTDSNSNNQSQTLEFRRPRNKSFVKVLNKRQQIRDKFKNDFFSGPNSPFKSPQTLLNKKESRFASISKVDEENNVSQQSLESSANTLSAQILNNETKNENNIFLFTEDDIQPVFLRINSKSEKDDIENDKKNNIFHIQQDSEYNNFESIYELQDILGEGCVGLVKKAVKISDQTEYAVKIVRTRDEETIMNIKNEFLHLRELKHNNIVKVYEIYIDQTKGKIYTVMELIKGREMFEVINQLGSYSEEIAKKIFKQIVNAISYMHSQYVCHRDLKPNNILCDETGENVKITDFNVSKFCDSYKDYSNNLPFQGIKMWTYTGTIAFSAPELFKESSYDESIDIWSAGVILYTMLCGKEPFQAEFVKDLINKIIQGEYSFPSDPWDKVSMEAKDLIVKCLTVNPEDRIKPEKMLLHPWLQLSKIPQFYGGLQYFELYNQMEKYITLFYLNLKKDNQKQKSELDRNQLGENIERLVKGITNSFDKQSSGRKRSSTQYIQLINRFKQSDYMFSNKCFFNPSQTEEENSDEEDKKNTVENQSPMRSISLTLQERPKENSIWTDLNNIQKNNDDKTYQQETIIKLDDHLQKISFLKQNNNKFNEINVFPNRKTSLRLIDNQEYQIK